MKNGMFKGVLAMAAIPMVLASCNSDEPRPEVLEYVTINRVGVGELSTRSGDIVATDNFLPVTADGDSLILFVKSSNADPLYSADYLRYSCDGTSWKPETNLAWGGGTAEWSAVYSFNASDIYDKETRKIVWTGPHNDLLYAYGTTSKSSIDIKMRHACAKVRVNLIDKYNLNPDIKRIECPGCSRNFATIEPGKDIVWGNVREYIYLSTPTSEKDGVYTYEYFSAPYEGSIYDPFILQINGLYENMHCVTPILTFEANKIYEIDLIFGGEYVKFESVTIKPWEDVENATAVETE